MKLTLLSLFWVVLLGCATPTVEQIPAEKIAQMSASSRDDFKKITSVAGPKVTIPNALSGYASMDFWQLAAEKSDASSEINYFIIFRFVSGHTYGWTFLTEMVDSTGRHFPLHQEHSELNGSLAFEAFSASIDRDYVNKLATAAMPVRLYGRRQIDVTLNTNVVAGFQTKLDAIFK
jgi:hypothetical protein